MSDIVDRLKSEIERAQWIEASYLDIVEVTNLSDAVTEINALTARLAEAEANRDSWQIAYSLQDKHNAKREEMFLRKLAEARKVIERYADKSEWLLHACKTHPNHPTMWCMWQYEAGAPPYEDAAAWLAAQEASA